MAKLKRVLKSKMFWIVLILIVVIISGILLWIKVKNEKETKEHVENFYEVWVSNEKVELIVKLKEEYDVCSRFFKKYQCSDKELIVTSFEILDEKLKDAFVDKKFSDLKTENVITSFILYALDQEMEFEKIEIISNYEFDVSFENKIKEILQDTGLSIEFFYGDLSYTGELEDTITYYTITFDTEGGTSIDSVVAKKNDTLEEPASPTKEGYTFLYWVLDGEEYDFTTKVNSDITLIAVWKENKISSNNDSSNNTTNNHSNDTNNNVTTSSKINLNNNISITEYHVSSGTINCFYYMFVTNLQEVFPTAEISKINNNPATVDFWHTSDRQDYEVSTEEINEYVKNGTLKINTAKETSFKNTLDKYKNGRYKGIANVSYTEDNHRFTFTYDYISFNGLKVSSNGEAANKEIQGILSSATKFEGPCGGFDGYENKVLNEELCSKYNLDCGRW